MNVTTKMARAAAAETRQPIIAPPRVVKRDPLFQEKQTVAQYGDRLDLQVVLLVDEMRKKFFSKRPYISCDAGPLVTKHRKAGHKQAMHSADNMMVDYLIETYFPDLLKQWSWSGARSRMFSIIRDLKRAHEEGIWGQEDS